ncbi:MAG: T9SS type A sorting domain-containing protein [Paludibacteraceae bacterium]|nr:T9SS type A sorting domain-containing protein [Paludibacteraceae bacterium]
MKKIIHTILLLLSISVYVHAANYDYLIVTTTKYTDAANRLKDWEASRGYKPYVMYLDTIHEGWQYTWTNRTTQKIREFYTKYGYNNIQYLTIIGCDTDIMPPTISPQVYDGNSDTSKYVKFTNSNGVNYYNIYGSIYNYRDWGAGIPIMTDNEFARNVSWNRGNTKSIPRGRISARTTQEAEEIIDKIIRYEWMPPTNQNCYTKALHMTLFQDYNNDGKSSRNWFIPTENITMNAKNKGINVNRIYFADYVDEANSSVTRAPEKDENGRNLNNSTYYEINMSGKKAFWEKGPGDIINAVDNGIMYAMYNGGHGQVYGYTPNSWDHYQRFVNIDPNTNAKVSVADLNNANAPTFFYNFTCWTGTFVGNGTLSDSYPRNKACGDNPSAGKYTKELMNDGCMCENLLRMHGGAVGAFGFAQTGVSTFNESSASTVMNKFLTTEQSVGECIFKTNFDDWHNIISMYFGDPSSHMFTVAPKSFSPEITKSGTSVTVNAKVANCTITLTNLLTDATTIRNNCSSTTFTGVNYPYTVTIKKHNYITYTGPETLYIQNRTFSRAKDVYGNNEIIAGKNVSSSYTQGNVTNNGSKVRFIARNKVSLKSGFSVKNNGKFTASVTHYAPPSGNTRKSVISGDEFEIAEEEMMEQNEETKFDIYPNPSDGQFTISLGAIEGPYNIEIIDIMGRVIYTKSDNKNEVNVDLSDKGSGVYHVKVYTNNKTWSSQVLIK